MPASNRRKYRSLTDVDWIQENFAYKYHDFKLTEKLRAVNTRHHSANAVVPNGDVAFAMDNPEMAAPVDQIYIYQLIATIHQLTNTNKILREKTKTTCQNKPFFV